MENIYVLKLNFYQKKYILLTYPKYFQIILRIFT